MTVKGVISLMLCTKRKTHPRQNIFITSNKNLVAKPYDVHAFKEFIDYFDSHPTEDTIKIPHVNENATYETAKAIRTRLQFHLDAMEKHSDMTIDIMEKESDGWVSDYMDLIKSGSDDLDLKSKIYYFCQPSNFGDYFLNEEKNNREVAEKILKDKNIKEELYSENPRS